MRLPRRKLTDRQGRRGPSEGEPWCLLRVGRGGRREAHGFVGVSVEESDSWRVTPKQTGGVEKLKERVEG